MLLGEAHHRNAGLAAVNLLDVFLQPAKGLGLGLGLSRLRGITRVVLPAIWPVVTGLSDSETRVSTRLH